MSWKIPPESLGWESKKEDKRERSLVGQGVMPVYGQEVRYDMEDGEIVKGVVIGIDDYENERIVTVKREDGSLYGAKFRKRKA